MSEDQPSQLSHGIGEVLDLLMEGASLGLGGLLHALARDIEEPAVVRAADAALFDVSVLQGSAPVGAVETEEAQAAARVAEEDELFAEDFESQGVIVEIRRGRHGEPVPPEPFSRRRPEAHVSEIRDGNLHLLLHEVSLPRPVYQIKFFGARRAIWLRA